MIDTLLQWIQGNLSPTARVWTAAAPAVLVEEDALPAAEIEAAVERDGALFNFAVDYANSHPDLGPDDKDNFFRSFNFKSEAPWLKVVSGDRYIRGDMAMSVNLRYDASHFDAMGVYSARVIANQDGGDLGGLAGREFYLWNTVVVGTPLTVALPSFFTTRLALSPEPLTWSLKISRSGAFNAGHATVRRGHGPLNGARCAFR